MQVYAVQIAQQRHVTLRIPAASAQAARVAADFTLRPGDTIRSVTEMRDVTAKSGRDALNHLLGREYLDLDGAPMRVEDWLLSARAAAMGKPMETGVERALNAKLALAAIRVDTVQGRVAIGSASRAPVLHHWFMGTPWEDTGLIRALSTLPGAERTLLTFAGLRSRAVSLPMAEVMPEGAL